MYCTRCGQALDDDTGKCPHCAQEAAAQEPALQRDAVKPEDLSLEELTRLYESEGGEGNEPQMPPYTGPAAADLKPGGFTVFTVQGRLNRAKYLYSFVLDMLATILLACGLVFATEHDSTGGASVFILIYYPIALLLLVARVMAIIKRLHDLNEPGSYLLMLLIPFYNFYVAFKLFFKESDPGISKYGKYERGSWYWQAPLALLVLPFVFLASSLVFSHMQDRAALAAYDRRATFTDAQRGISMEYPMSWIAEEADGMALSVRNGAGTQSMSLELLDTDGLSFSSYTEEALNALVDYYADKAHFTEMFGLDGDSLYELTCKKALLDGRAFVLCEYVLEAGSYRIRRRAWLGIYDGTMIVLQTSEMAGTDKASTEALLDIVDTFRVED